jgi:galactose mutarotase-like enzyme
VFNLKPDDKLKQVYPFDFALTVSYALTGNSLTVCYSVKNTGGSPLLYSIGAHPAFRLPVHPGARRSDYELVFERGESTMIHLIEGGLLSGEKRPFLLENNRLPISDSLFDNDALVFKKLASKKISIAKKKEPPFLNFHFDAPFFGIWSKSRTSEFVCLEPWQGVADSLQHDQQFANKEGVVTLAAQQSRDFSFTVEIME